MPQEIPLDELQRGVRGITWQHGLISIGVFAAAIVVAKLVGHLVRWAFSRGARGPAFAFSKLLTYGVFFVGVVIALRLLGISPGSLVLTSGALLVGIGFSLQHVVRDVVAGIVLLVEQSIRQNDFVSYAETTGTVHEIGLRATQLRTRDGTVLVVPNHLLVTNEVTNHTYPFRRSRVLVEIPADVGESPDEAGEAIRGVAERHREVLREPVPTVRLAAITPGGFRFVLVVWIGEAIAANRVSSELRFGVSRAFAARGIRFPITAISLSAPRRVEAEPDGQQRPAEQPPAQT